MLAHFAILVAMEAASSVTFRYVLPAFTRRLERASLPGRFALCGAAAAVGLSALATRPTLARGIVQSLALSQAGRAVTSLRATS
jgi:hypothetical protein